VRVSPPPPRGRGAGRARRPPHDREFGYVVDRGQRYHGLVSVDSLQQQLRQSEPSISAAFLEDIPILRADTAVSDLLGTVANAPCGLPVVDEQNRYMGVITRASLLETLDRDN
jgi:glycine betaine/proline transport system ATP-binding protein